METPVDIDHVKERSKRALDAASQALEAAARSTWLQRMARWGLSVRGVLYVVTALLAVQVARGHPEKRADSHGALFTVLHEPFGRVLLVVLAAGFVGYAAWRYVEAVVGPPGEDDDARSLAKRALYLFRGLVYTALFYTTVKLVMWSSAAEGSDTAKADWTARVFRWPGGRWLVAAVGIGIIVVGLAFGWRGLSRTFGKRLKQGEMGTTERRVIVGLGSVGMVARSIVAALVGVFLIGAATHHDPNEAVGVDGALERLAGRPWGPSLLMVVAAGLAAYGLYSFAEARYRRVGNS